MIFKTNLYSKRSDIPYFQ